MFVRQPVGQWVLNYMIPRFEYMVILPCATIIGLDFRTLILSLLHRDMRADQSVIDCLISLDLNNEQRLHPSQ